MSKLANKMNKWYVEESDEGGYVVIHYVGGEGCYELWDYYDDAHLAMHDAQALNVLDITYEFRTVEEGYVRMFIDWNGAQELTL